MARRFASVLLLLLLLIGFYPRAVYAQNYQGQPDLLNMSLEDLMTVDIDSVYGSAGYKQKVSDAPGSITIITADEIQRYGYRTLADVLRNVPGFYVTSDRAYNYVGMRGFGPPGDWNSRIILLVDGHRLGDPVDGGTDYGPDFPIDLDLVDRVEVIRGPNSSVYIASALLGVINIVTKRGRDVEGLSIAQELASYGTERSRVSYGHQFDNGLEILLSSSILNSNGPARLYFPEFDSPSTNNGVAANADGEQSYQGFARVSYRNFTMEAAYAYSDQQDPTASYGAIFNDPEERIRVIPGYADLSYDHKFGADWGYLCRIYYDSYRYHGTYPDDESDSGGAPHVLNQDWSSGQDAGASFTLSKKLLWGQTLLVGSEYREIFQQAQWNYDSQPYFRYLTSDHSENVVGAHVQDEIPIAKRLILDVGFSFDHYSTFGSAVNPRADLIYEAREGTTFKLLYGQSFRAPTPFELYYAIPGQEANPYLKPETAKTTELVFEQSLPRSVQLVVSGYYYPIRDLITSATDPANGLIVYGNNERVNLTGTEITVKRQSHYGFEFAYSLSLEQARRVGAATALVDSPRVLSQASASVPLFKRKLFASMDLQFVSRRLTLAGNYAGAYILPNFTLYSRQAFRGWELSASVYNATDELYGDPASVAHVQDVIYQDGRNFRVKFIYHF